MTATPRAILFDLGNVLVDVDYRLAIQRFPPGPLSGEEMLHRITAAGLIRETNLGRLAPVPFYERVRELVGLPPEMDFLAFRAAYCSIFRAKPEMDRLLARLAPRCRLGLLSNTDLMHHHVIEEQFPIFSVPTVRVLSYQVGLFKPDPAIYRLAVERLGTAPAETLFVDDLQANVDGARAVGLQGLLFSGEPALARDLQHLGMLTPP